jgi:hypothetical protein
MEGQHQSCHKPDYAQGGWVAEKRDGFEQAHGPGGAVVMEKLRDGQIDLRQTRLFSDLVAKVHEQRTRRCHYQQACQEHGAQPTARVTQSVVQEGKIPTKAPNAK